MKDSEFLTNSFYHYKYRQNRVIETLFEKRVSKVQVILSKKYGYPTYSNHTDFLVVKDLKHFFKNPAYKVLLDQNSTNSKVGYTFEAFPFYISLNTYIVANAPAYNHWVELQITADEYKLDNHVTEFTSDFFQIEANKFSIILPKYLNSENDETSAVLTLIYNGEVITYDPYLFTEDARLKKLNTLPYGADKVELLFLLK